MIVILLAAPVFGDAQDKIKLDSLELELKNARNDSLRTMVLMDIATEYSGNNYLKAAHYAQQAIDLAREKNIPSALIPRV